MRQFCKYPCFASEPLFVHKLQDATLVGKNLDCNISLEIVVKTFDNLTEATKSVQLGFKLIADFLVSHVISLAQVK